MDFRAVVLLAGLTATFPFSTHSAEPAPVVLDFDFTAGTQGWSAFFADHPPGVDQAWELAAGLRPLPTELGVEGTGFMTSGMNHSDDLVMALKRRLGPAEGIEPGVTYWVEFEIVFASNAPTGAPGIGGSPGESVHLKAGASATEPSTALDAPTNHLRLTVNGGSQALGGPAATPAGVIANGRPSNTPPQYVTLRRSHRHRFPVQAAADGSLWLLVLTDSGFEGKTTLYYQRIRATLTPVTVAAGRLINVSTRADVGSGESLVIAGFVVHGTSRGTYLIRGVGPSLADHGVSGVLGDPILTLRDHLGAPLLMNDDWGTFPDPALLRQTAAAVGAFPLREGSKDAALRVELEPGLYSAFLERKGGEGGAAGIGLVEVYEVNEASAKPRLVNLSTRARIGEGEKAVFAGFYVRGPDPERLLIRAVGPTLQDYGIQRPATHPILTLYAGSTAIAANEAWQQHNAGEEIAAAARRAGAFPLRDDSRDAALLVTLEPGIYSVQVEGDIPTHDEIVLIEVYRVP